MFSFYRPARIAVGLVAVFAFATLATITSAATLSQIKERGYVRVAVANENPYGYINSRGLAEGFAPSTAKLVLERMGIDEIQWVVMPYGTLIPALQKNRVDIVAASLAIRPERCAQVAYSAPNSSYGEALMVKKDNPEEIHGYQAFVKDRNLDLGYVTGADQLEIAKQVGVRDAQLKWFLAYNDTVGAVAAGRVDGYAGTYYTVKNLVQDSDRIELAKPFRAPVINGEKIRSWGAFGFNKQADSLRRAFNKQLIAFQKTPKWKNILRYYGMKPQAIDAIHQKTTAELCDATDD